ncbi:inositol monophosphatase [Candidatus Microgenomates bacterium]|nr:inositol monophosphatase [Candidatus Microgenomates bacterium]
MNNATVEKSIFPREETLEGFLLKITKQAGDIAGRLFGKGIGKDTKKDVMDYVTEADRAANRHIVSAIQKRYPKDGIISEEAEAINPFASRKWIVDPLDGTISFTRNIPGFATMVAVTEDGVFLSAAVYNPITGQLFSTRKGGGAFLNGERIFCSNPSELDGTIGATTLRLTNNTSRERKFFWDNFTDIWGSKNTFLYSGWSAGLAAMLVACGQADWYVRFNNKIWDVAPLVLILAEAGCTVTDIDGQPYPLTPNSHIVAAPPSIHEEILALARRTILL